MSQPRKRLMVVGANGALGRRVVAAALDRGHHVTALVRRAESLEATGGLTVVEGRVGDRSVDLSAMLTGHDAVLSGLGNHSWLHGRRADPVMTDALGNLVSSMTSAGVQRIVVPMAWGAGVSRAHSSLLVRGLTRTMMRRDFDDLDGADRVIAGSPLHWTVAFFGALSDGESTGHWSASRVLVAPNPLRIRRSDVADFLVRAVEESSYVRTHVTLSGAKTTPPRSATLDARTLKGDRR